MFSIENQNNGAVFHTFSVLTNHNCVSVNSQNVVMLSFPTWEKVVISDVNCLSSLVKGKHSELCVLVA